LGVVFSGVRWLAPAKPHDVYPFTDVVFLKLNNFPLDYYVIRCTIITTTYNVVLDCGI
jgi:hypothetical protein